MARRMRNMVQSATELVRVATLAGSAEIRSGKYSLGPPDSGRGGGGCGEGGRGRFLEDPLVLLLRICK